MATAVQHKCKKCGKLARKRWSIRAEWNEEIQITAYMCDLCAYKNNAYVESKGSTEYAREIFDSIYWNVPVKNRYVYCIYYILIDGFDDPQDYCAFTVSDAKSWEDIAEKELLSGDEISRVDVYNVPESLRDKYGYELDLSDLGECLGSASRQDLINFS